MRTRLTLLLILLLFGTVNGNAQTKKTTTKKATVAQVKPAPPPAPAKPVGFPQDAGPHDKTASIEWWYFNSFLKTDTGRNLAVVGSFFRTGLTPTKKGHYLIYALIDLDTKEHQAFSIIDRANIALLQSALPLLASSRPEDPRPYQLLRMLQNNELPPPHQKLDGNAIVKVRPTFSITFDNNWLMQEGADGRTWQAQLAGGNSPENEWLLDLTLTQPERPAMLVGGKGMTGVKRPNEMYYLSLTRMQVTGQLTSGGVVEKVAGDGWLDRQWGSPAFVASYGWDWFGIQLDNGDDLILARIRDVNTGKAVKYEATILTKEGETILDKPTLSTVGTPWRDPKSNIAFPTQFEVTLPVSGYKLRITPAFEEQTIPVIGIGDAIWEGVINVEGSDKTGALITGRGYMELVGYRASKPPAKTEKVEKKE